MHWIELFITMRCGYKEREKKNCVWNGRRSRKKIKNSKKQSFLSGTRAASPSFTLSYTAIHAPLLPWHLRITVFLMKVAAVSVPIAVKVEMRVAEEETDHCEARSRSSKTRSETRH